MKFNLNQYNTLCNVGNSILKKFNAPTHHETFVPLDKALEKTKKEKVCLVLFDAFGKTIIERYKKDIPFIYSHIYTQFLSVFPPTTVAATTSLTTGRYPLETNYLGWTQYFKQYDDEIDVFPSTSKFTGNKYTPSLSDSLLKHDKIWDEINKNNGENIASFIQSFEYSNLNKTDKENLDDYFEATDKKLNNYKFLYSYCTEPDHTMHNTGIGSIETRNIIIYLSNKLEELTKKHPETLFILIADHSMIDTLPYYFNEYKEFKDSLATPYISIEGRFAGFNVKNYEQFLSFYKKKLSHYFALKSKEEILEEHTFGYGCEHPLFRDSLKDYFLISTSCYALNDGLKDFLLIGHHAGGTIEERELYMMIFNK